MGRVAVLKIRADNLQQGFRISLQVFTDTSSLGVGTGDNRLLLVDTIEGNLPALSDLFGIHQSWYQEYIGLIKDPLCGEIIVDESIATHSANVSGVNACRQFSRQLRTSIQNLLENHQDVGWTRIQQHLIRQLANSSDEIRVLIQADDPRLWKLPWHEWRLLQEDSSRRVEVAFSHLLHPHTRSNRVTPPGKVKIVALVDNVENLYETVTTILNNLNPSAIPKYPTDLDRLLDELRRGCEILIFAGHGRTGDDGIGRITYKGSEITVDSFASALKTAVSKGLKLVFLCCCDCFGLITDLKEAGVNIPVIIAMREEISVKAAQDFFTNFFGNYATEEQPFYPSFLQARQILEKWEDKLPGTNRIPMIYQILSVKTPSWEELTCRMICCLNPNCQNPMNPYGTSFCLNCRTGLVRRVRDRYRILERIGGGRFGRTYLAEDKHNRNQRCVVKQLAPQVQSSSAQNATNLFEQFRQQASSLQKLGKQAQIPTVYDYFQEGNSFYLVQEFVAGKNLLQELEQGNFSEQKIVDLLNELLPILQLVHAQTIIHRDIKPENIIRQSDGTVVLVDFGVAMGEACPADDLYSLGAACFQLLTNVNPCNLQQNDSYRWVRTWQQHLSQPVSSKLKRVLSKLLKERRQQRYQSADEVLRDLNRRYPSVDEVLRYLNRHLNNLYRRYNRAIAFAVIALVFILGWIFYNGILRNGGIPIDVSTKISIGEDIAVGEIKTGAKGRGSGLFKTAMKTHNELDFDNAIEEFKESLSKEKNDPETSIYIQNAIAEKKALTDTKSKLKIAVVVKENEESLRGVSQSQTKFNCGNIELFRGEIEQEQEITKKQEITSCQGTNGKTLEVVIANYTDKTRDAVAQALVDDPSILGVVGRYTSSELKEVNSIYAGKLVLVAPTSNATRNALGLNPNYIFRVMPDVTLTVEHLKEYLNLNKIGQSKLAILFGFGNDYSGSLKDEVRSKIAQPVILYQEYCDLSAQTFKVESCIKQVQESGSKKVLLIPELGKLDNAIKVINHVYDKNLNLTFIGSDTLYEQKVLDEVKEAASKEKLVIAVPWARTDDNNTEFERDAQNLWGSLINWRTAMSFDATQVLLKGLEKQPSRTGLQKVLNQSDFQANGVTGDGTIKFGDGKRAPKGDRIPDDSLNFFVEVVKDRSGKTNFQRLEEGNGDE